MKKSIFLFALGTLLFASCGNNTSTSDSATTDADSDTEMVEDKNHGLIIRIGVCNEIGPEKKKQVLPLFQEKFDIVIENDEGLESICDLIIKN